MNTFMPALYINDQKDPYTILYDGTFFKDESDTKSLYHIVKNKWIPKTWLGFDERPYMIWTGCHGRITPLENLEPDEDLLNLIREKGLIFFLYEPLSTYRIHIENRYPDHQHYDQFETTDLNISSLHSFELDSISIFAQKYGLKNIWVYSCDYNIIKYYGAKYPDIRLGCQDIFIASDCVVETKIKPPYKTKKVHKKFWCGNWRYNGIRHLVMMYLASTDSFYNGNYSWYVYGGRGHVSGKLWFDLSTWETKYPGVAHKLAIGEEILNAVVPLSMDILEPPMHYIGSPENKNPPPVASYRLPIMYADCFVAIVNESRFAQPTANFSEKILNAVRAYRPFVLFAPPKTLEYFKQFGFKTFGDFWDESYDDELDHEIRLIKLFKVIDYIDKLSIQECRDLLEQMQPILEHNAKIVLELATTGELFSQ